MTERFSVTLLPAGWTFEASSDQPLLLAAQAAGIKLPSSCRNGTCRACLCFKPEGEITYRIEWPGVSFDEKREGWILPCCAYPRSAVTLDVPHASRSATRP
ncbi:2Fe-2S iron-sulfur cluster-binding protein [Pandoraea terrae]|nr:2Fe-2S iron-sulfur cluster-binding protein [Pandoraea terrae]